LVGNKSKIKRVSFGGHTKREIECLGGILPTWRENAQRGLDLVGTTRGRGEQLQKAKASSFLGVPCSFI